MSCRNSFLRKKMLNRLHNIVKTMFATSLKTACFALFACVLMAQNASAATIKNLRIGQGTNSFRIVFDADGQFNYKAFLLSNPRRLVFDVYDCGVVSQVEKYRDKTNLVSRIRVGRIDGSSQRIAMDLQTPVVIKKAFMLAPQSSFGWRFVVDVEVASSRKFDSRIGSGYAFNGSEKKNKSSSHTSTKAVTTVNSKAKKVVVIDPGHGGKDPGAIGYSGVYEKNITLAMAKELKAILDKEGRYKVYLTRSTDIFIPLRDRVKIARKHDADLFLSIHADSAVNRSAKGLSVYTLSETASDKEAEALAERENKADVIAGLDLLEHSKEVSDILINLAQRETMNRSSEFAGFMVQEMRRSVQLVDNTHRFAGFAVLKAPDVPSVLLEMGYLSNRTEERQLKQSSYRKKLATSASKAIRKYFDNMQHASVF